MKKHQLEVLLRELAASEELPGWQDTLHQMVQAELAAMAGRQDTPVEKNDLILAGCPLQNHDSLMAGEEQAGTNPKKAS